MMGKLSFFLGLHISQSPRGIFLNQSKYALESIKKYGMETCDPSDTPMIKKYKLDDDPQGKAVDPTPYRGMIGTLMYLTATIPDLVFDVSMCARMLCSNTLDVITIDILWPCQFYYSIKKVQGINSYKFLLANKKCVVNADVFRMILDICPKVEGVNRTNVPDDDTTLEFLIKLGYKGPLYKHTNMFVDHMHQPWRTLAAIINKCLSGKTTINDKLRKSKIDLLRRDHDVKICHFPDSPRIDEDYQDYGLSIPETMMTKAIKQFESYQMFITYSTCQIPPKKSKDKGSQRKKTTDDSQETINVYKEFEPKPEPVKRKTSNKRRLMKKVTLSADDNIISDDLENALELGKIVTESVLEPTKRRKSRKVTFDTPKKLKGVPSLTPKEQEAVKIMQALKESKKTSKRQPCTGGSSEGTGTISGVPNESIVVYATSSEGTGTKPGVPDEGKDITEENVILEWESEQESEYSKEDKLDDEEKDDKEGEEMLNAKVDDYVKGDEEVTNAVKTNAEKTLEVKDDAKKTKIPLTSSSLSVSSGFGDQFLKLSSDPSLVSTIMDATNAEINSLLEVKIQSEVPHIQSPSMLRVLVFVIFEPSVLTPIQESPSKAIVTTLAPPSVSTTPSVPQETTTPILTPIITTNALIITTTISESDALSVDENAIDKGVADTVQDHKTKHDDDEDDDDDYSQSGPNQSKKTKRRRTKDSKSSKKRSTTKEIPKGKAPFKGFKTGKSASAKEPVEEPIAEVVMDDTGDDVVHDDDQPQDASEPKIAKTLNPEWFTQPLRPPTSNPEWNIELEYHFQECFNALTDRLDWNNLEGDHYPFDLFKPLPLQGHPDYGERADCRSYKFKENDFVDLHMNNIEDMLLLAVQHKLFHLIDNDIVDFIMALCIFTRSLVIKNRIKDLHARSGFDEIKEFLGCLKDFQVLDNLFQHKLKHYVKAFAWQIPILVTVLKTVLHHSELFKGFKVQLGEDPIQARMGGLRAGGEGHVEGSNSHVACIECYPSLDKELAWKIRP
nr:uncharacterized mitochondrial protein AtMg00810-like [Tanacetum cinerariifolium]